MPKRKPHSRVPQWVRGTVTALRRAWLALRHRRHTVAALVTDPARRRSLEREVRQALDRLDRVLGYPIPVGSVVVVQQVIGGDRNLAGAYQVVCHQAGSEGVRVQLALQVGRRRLSTEEVLATLAEAALRLADERVSATVGVRVPLTLPATDAGPAERPLPERDPGLPPDPLMPITPITDHARHYGQVVTRSAA